MLVAAFSGLDGFPRPESQPETYRALAAIGDETASRGARLLVALEQERIAGAVVFYANMAAYRPGGTAPHEIEAAGFRFLAVDPQARRRGIAAALVEHCVGLARTVRRRRLVVHSTEAMKGARAILAARGFQRAPSLDFEQDATPVHGFRLPL